MIALKGVQETHPRMACCCVYQLVYPRHGERVLGACFVQVREVYTNSSLSTFLLDYHGVGQPFKVKNLFDNPCMLKLHHLVSDCVNMLS